MAKNITMFLHVPQLYPSVKNKKKHFGHSFAFHASTAWNDLPDDVHSVPTLVYFRKKAKRAFPLYPINDGINDYFTILWCCLSRT